MSACPDAAPAELTLDEVVAHWARRKPQEPALRCTVSRPAANRTWGEFERAIALLARTLARTIEPGEAVAVVCAAGLEFHVLVNALWRCGAGVLLLDRNWGPAITSDLVKLVACRTVFSKFGVAADGLPAVVVEYPSVDWPQSADCGEANVSLSGPDSVALYATTSGTTDNPKCVAITHRKIRSAYNACLTVHSFSSIENCACVFDINSLGVLGVCFLLPREIGACTTIYPSFSISNISTTWKAVLRDRVDFVYLVPPLVRLLNALPSDPQGRRPLLAFCSAAPVAEAELRQLENKYPVRVFNAYGLTELTFAVFFGCRAHDDCASESIGFPVGIHASLVDDRGEVVIGAGSGELRIIGPMSTERYLHNPAATAAAWKDGWFWTGDIAERDQSGRYYIRGRQKDVVLRGGYTYYFHELEHYLRRVPSVIDVCAFKGRDLASGDELCVVVQVGDGATASGLLEWVRVNMGPTKVPNVLHLWRRALPRNSNGKIQRNLLMQMYADGTIDREGRA